MKEIQDYSAREWVKQGAPKEKLMIGMPTYGRSFELVNTSQFDIGAPASGGGVEGRYTAESGFLSYYEICEFLHEDNTTLVWDNEQQVPFAYRGNQWVGFDDERSLKTKVRPNFYVLSSLTYDLLLDGVVERRRLWWYNDLVYRYGRLQRFVWWR